MKNRGCALDGAGTFAVAGRQERNPRTGEAIEIKPRRVPIIRAGSILKREVNQGNQG